MFKKILIANRGEIAVRIIRCCKEMGIEAVAVYSSADATSLHVQLADEAYCIGPAKSSESYLNMENILSVATLSGCDAIHPGFGYLSENSTFARLVEKCGMTFIGPSGDVIDQMGNKSVARQMMIEAGVPVVPGSDGSIESVSQGKEIARKIGYPVLIKASAGGGGRGMRKCFKEEDFENAYLTAKAEAKACFGDDDMYMEKLILNPKHIEFQILADHFGNVIHLGERDCSIQRKNQKVIEETPSTILDDKLRNKMGEAAIKAVKASSYTSCGTVEFLVDSDKNFYFMEMNTRIQVEHPITEMRTGIDIVKEQIKIAAGEKLKIKQKNVQFKGHSIECRINAENPRKKFRPSPGKITGLNLPGGNGVRIDTAIYEGYTIPANYDSMIAKIITYGDTRNEAISKMKRALEETVIEGIDTNLDFLFQIIKNPNFLRGKFDTSFIEKEILEKEE